MRLDDSHVIYGLIDPETRRIRYVGKTNDPEHRMRQHLYEKEDTHKARWIASLRRRGLRPELIILEEADDETWAEREEYWIAHLRESGCDLTNHTDGGDGTVGFRHSEESKRKMSINRKGKGGWRKGIPMSEEAKQKMSEARKGKPCPWVSEANSRRKISAETRAKKRAYMLGRKASPEHIKNQVQGLHNYWANLSPEDRERRVSAAREGRQRQAARVRAEGGAAT